MKLAEFVVGAAADLALFLGERSDTVLALVSKDLVIEDCNRAFMRCFGLDKKPLGESLGSYLETGKDPVEALGSGGAAKRTTFTGRGGLSQIMDYHVMAAGGRFMIIGERLLITESDAVATMSELQEEMVNLTRELTRKNRELENARSKIKVLSGLLPICMYCKKIRDDEGYWGQLEAYIDHHSEAQFSHSICPDCMEQYFPDEGDED